jgi:hypothetical protein
VEPGERRGGCSEGVEGTEQIVMETGNGDLICSDRTTGDGLGFEGQNIPAGIGQGIGGNEPIGPGSNHDGIDAHVLP